MLFRHVRGPGVGDPPGFRIGDCATQRNLSEEGRRQAARIGERLRAEGVPVTAVLASQWCRAFDTAQIAFPELARMEPAFNSFFEDRPNASAITERGRFMLQGWKGPERWSSSRIRSTSRR